MAAITDFVAQFSATYADELASRITDAANRLVDSPEIGRKNSALASEHIRELLVEKYRLAHYVDKQLITILAIRHQAQKR